MKSADVIIVGAGVIGLSTAWRLHREGVRVLLMERSEPAREASYAAGGMIAVCDPHNDSALQPLAELSAAAYPEFVRELEEESGCKVDFRQEGVVTHLDPSSYSHLHPRSRSLSAKDLAELEPGIPFRENMYYLPETWIDPRLLCTALVRALKHRNAELLTGSSVTSIKASGTGFTVTTEQSTYRAERVINCAGAWSGNIGPVSIPVRPVKGQVVAVVPVSDPEPRAPVLRHVVRAPQVYIIPRSDGRIVIGSTLEEAGFDKTVNPEVIQQLLHSASEVVPALRELRMHDSWAGLRPGTPDGLPILGGAAPGYYVATGHYRDGILLAPVTASLLLALVQGKDPGIDLRPFSPHRFQR